MKPGKKTKEACDVILADLNTRLMIVEGQRIEIYAAIRAVRELKRGALGIVEASLTE